MGSITVRLTDLAGLDLAKQVNLLLIKQKKSSWIQKSQIWGQPYSDAFPMHSALSAAQASASTSIRNEQIKVTKPIKLAVASVTSTAATAAVGLSSISNPKVIPKSFLCKKMGKRISHLNIKSTGKKFAVLLHPFLPKHRLFAFYSRILSTDSL